MTDLESIVRKIKEEQLTKLNGRREQLYTHPELRLLFLELTLKCNEKCFHCGSNCAPDCSHGLPVSKYREILDEVKDRMGTDGIQICVTGGEPLLYPEFFDLMEYVHGLGFRWGMTSNATLITKETAGKLHHAGMGTISVSIDGLEETHDRQRGLKGAYARAMSGIRNLIDEGGFQEIQITSVMNHQSIGELDDMYETIRDMDIGSWRVVGLEPIGRALEFPELMLTKEDYRRLFDFIREKREERMPVTYGCSHYLGLTYEREVRKWYFLCNAGIHAAGIMANGDIGACLDIERRPETIQGNVWTDSFVDVWQTRFKIFRERLSGRCRTCRECPHEAFCAGGAYHSFHYDTNEQMVCMKGILF